MNSNNAAQTGTVDRAQENGGRVGLFGEFNATGVGSDLTLEWDSSDPDLHAHPHDGAKVTTPASDEDDRYRHFHQAGLPDA